MKPHDTQGFTPTPIKYAPVEYFYSREGEWLKPYTGTHMKTNDISRKYGIGRAKLLLILPKPCLISPYGNRTKLWHRDVVLKVMGD